MNESVKVSSNDLLVAMLCGDLRGWSGRLPSDERVLAQGSSTALPVSPSDTAETEPAPRES